MIVSLGSVVVDMLFIVTPIVGVCNCSMFCCMLLYVPSSFAIILMGKRGLVALLSLSSWCLVIVVWLFLAVPWFFLQFVIVVFPENCRSFPIFILTYYFGKTIFDLLFEWTIKTDFTVYNYLSFFLLGSHSENTLFCCM